MECSNTNSSFLDWSASKKKYNSLINRAVFKFIASLPLRKSLIGGDDVEYQIHIDTISELMLLHFRQRKFIFIFLSKFRIKNRNLFSSISFAILACSSLVNLVAAMLRLGRSYTVEINETNLGVVIATSFPSHSFSVERANSRKASQNTRRLYSSFGEYLLDEELSAKIRVISCGELVRHSKAKEKNTNISIASLNSLNRLQAFRSFKLKAFILDCKCSVIWALRNLPILHDNPFLFLRKYKLFLTSLKFRRLFTHLTVSGVYIKRIYTCPFDESLGDLKYDLQYRNMVVTYSYAGNIFIPPSSLGNAKLTDELTVWDYLRGIPLQAFSLSGNFVGFTNSYELVRKAKAGLYCYFSHYELSDFSFGFTRSIPCALGYEEVVRNISPFNGKTVAVFDVPPETRETQMRRAVIGDRTCDFEFIRNFIAEICDVANKTNSRVIFKPKYSVMNYDSKYREFIEFLRLTLADKFLVVSPYARLKDILDESDLCLTFPYGTTKSLAEHLAIKSFYFIPSSHKCEFISGCIDSNQLIESGELLKQLCK